MRDIKAIILKEWKCFKGSDRGQFLFYFVLIISWSLFLAFRGQQDELGGPWWLVFFSVVVTANFSNNVFIAERVNGVLEILITSGFSRRSILAGKMIFILTLSVVMGGACLLFGTFIRNCLNSGIETLSFWDLATFISAAFLNTSGAAYLSVRMSNPRLLHLANMFILTLLIIIYSLVSYHADLPLYTLAIAFFFIASVLTWLAVIEFESERILRPVDL